MVRRLQFSLRVLLAAVSLAAVCAWWMRDDSVRLPKPSSVMRMTATVYDRRGEDEFVVPEARWAQVLDALAPSRRDPKPAMWVVIGDLRITCKSGLVVLVNLFASGDAEAAFSVNTAAGGQCFRGGLDRAIRRALKDARDQAPIKEMVESTDKEFIDEPVPTTRR